MASLSDITKEFYAIVNQPTNSSVYPGVDSGGSFVENLADNVQDEICRARKWPFLKKKTMVAGTGVKTTLVAGITPASLSLSIVNNLGWPLVSTGNFAVWIEGDIIDFTVQAAGVISGITNMSVPHRAGVDVELLYQLPPDFSHVPRLFLQEINFQRMEEYYKIDEDEDEVLSYAIHNFNPGGIPRRWSIVSDQFSNEWIRISNPPSFPHIFLFRYYKACIPFNGNPATIATIPDPFALKVIPKLMAAKAMMTRGDNPDGLADGIKATYTEEIQKMMRYYGFRYNERMRAIQNKYKSGVLFQERRTIIR